MEENWKHTTPGPGREPCALVRDQRRGCDEESASDVLGRQREYNTDRTFSCANVHGPLAPTQNPEESWGHQETNILLVRGTREEVEKSGRMMIGHDRHKKVNSFLIPPGLMSKQKPRIFHVQTVASTKYSRMSWMD